ncbi:hypothetical protein OK016_29000 [Vibrio chagasii]|nr:hypothetical protein [Vibrio chagasii]
MENVILAREKITPLFLKEVSGVLSIIYRLFDSILTALILEEEYWSEYCRQQRLPS